MAKQSAPAFQTEATDGKGYHLDTLTKESPILLMFIKQGCPCSESAQPFFNRLYEAYGVLQGVVVEKGIHPIEIKYHPQTVYWGAALTSLGLFATAFLMLKARRSRSDAYVEPL